METRHTVPSKFKVLIDRELCRFCKRCTVNCTFGAMSFEGGRIIPDHHECVCCQRCAMKCPQEAISIIENPSKYSPHGNYTNRIRRIIYEQSSTGGVLLSSTGTNLIRPTIFDDLLLDACQVTNPSIDPLREPVETKTYIGRKPDKVDVTDENNRIKLSEDPYPYAVIETPILVGHMSLGAISFNASHSLLRAAQKAGIMVGTGEGGIHEDFYQYKKHIIAEVASGRFGVNQKYLKNVSALEIKIGQGAKPGHGGHLPAEKIDAMIASTRMMPKGTDALSPYPQHDIYSIEDLRQLIGALKEASRYKVPVGVKIAAVHNSAAIAVGMVRGGADFITIDGYKGGTGAAPRIIRDHAGIPLEVAIASVDKRLREEGIRHWATVIASGGVRYSADMVKAIALGADAVSIGTSVLVAMGCTVCQQCHRGLCPWGIATQQSNLVKRLDPEVTTQRLVNMYKAWTEELREILGAMGIDSVESMVGNRDRLRYMGSNPKIAEILGVKHIGE